MTKRILVWKKGKKKKVFVIKIQSLRGGRNKLRRLKAKRKLK